MAESPLGFELGYRHLKRRGENIEGEKQSFYEGTNKLFPLRVKLENA